MKDIVEIDSTYPIQPKHIDASKHLFGAFDHTETEVSAGWLVRFAQERDAGWTPFTLTDIGEYYARWIKTPFGFNRLVEPELVPPSLLRALEGHRDPRVPRGGGWILKSEGKYHFTHEFVSRCHGSSPATPTVS